MVTDATTASIIRLEEFKIRTEARLKEHDGALQQFSEFKSAVQGEKRIYKLMWGILCTAIGLDLSVQAFIYRQQTKNAEDIRGVQETQQIILQILKGEYRGK